MDKPRYWDEATRSLARVDPVMQRLVGAYPGIHLARRSDAFTALARAICGQQISVQGGRGGVAAVRRRGRTERSAGPVPRARARGRGRVRPRGAARLRAVRAQGALRPRPRAALRRGPARSARLARPARRGTDRRALRGEGHRALDRRDVPHLPRAAAGRAAAGRHRAAAGGRAALPPRPPGGAVDDPPPRRDVATVAQRRHLVPLAVARSRPRRVLQPSRPARMRRVASADCAVPRTARTRCRSAWTASSRRSATPSLPYTAVRWWRTVFSVMPSFWAMARLCSPSAISATTSRSRSVSVENIPLRCGGWGCTSAVVAMSSMSRDRQPRESQISPALTLRIAVPRWSASRCFRTTPRAPLRTSASGVC